MKKLILTALLSATAILQAESPDAIQVTPDVVYATWGTRELKLDIYRPQSSKPLPGIVVIRGGGWKVGDKKGFAPIARNLAAKGFVAACIEYRVMPDVQIMDEVYDTKAAVRWMRAEGKRFGIATDSIGVIGGSAGGHLVALLGTSYKEAKLEGTGGHPGVSSRVQAVVAMAPVVDFVSREGARGADAVATLFKNNLDLAKSLAPVTYVSKDSAPLLLIHGDADKAVDISQSQEILDRYKQAGARASLITVKDGPHGFWNRPEWSADTITQAAAFFHDVLGN